MRARQILFAVALMAGVLGSAGADEPKTENILWVMLDGLRWQEVFTGAEESLLSGRGGIKDASAIKELYWRDTPEERRETLMPFLWKNIAKNGIILGNSTKGSVGRVTNKMHFSYPGYSD